MSPYEQAVKRFSAAVRDHAIATAEADAMVRAADDEREAAEANLAAHEVSPGVPLPEFREAAIVTARRELTKAIVAASNPHVQDLEARS